MSKATRIHYGDMCKNMGLNQQAFRSPVGVTRSGGSRYESGRAAPRPVAEQVRLRHEPGIAPALITADNAALIKALLQNDTKGGSNGRAD